MAERYEKPGCFLTILGVVGLLVFLGL